MAVLSRPRSARGAGGTLRARVLLVAGCAALGSWLGPPIAAIAGSRAAPPPRPLEYQVKAAFLFNFAKFVEWPAESFHDRDPLSLCVFGQDPFGATLDATLAGETVAGRPLRARRIDRPGELRSCQVVFIGDSERERVPAVLAELRGADVLTVGESPRFAEQGGMVRFFVEDNRVRFEINLDAVERTRLVISSKLLRVARVVRPESRPENRGGH